MMRKVEPVIPRFLGRTFGINGQVAILGDILFNDGFVVGIGQISIIAGFFAGFEAGVYIAASNVNGGLNDSGYFGRHLMGILDFG